MNAREEAEALRQQAIARLLDERSAIDQLLKLLGYGQDTKAAPPKRRGRPPKTLDNASGFEKEAETTHQTALSQSSDADLVKNVNRS